MDKSEKLKNMVSERTGVSVDAIGEDTNLYDLGLDPLDEVDFLMDIEETFDILFPDDAKIANLRDIEAYMVG